jgi:hypothetical protein
MKFPRTLGILVLGFNRPELLRLVLESLKRQSALPFAHIWIDGTSGRQSFHSEVRACHEIAFHYSAAEVRTHAGHLGIERLMLDGLAHMMDLYDRILVLEDDCTPTLNALELFSDMLDQIRSRNDVFSAYGHWFMVPAEDTTITRFQGWGWAAHRKQLLPVLSEVKELFDLNERDYLGETRRRLTPAVRSRLDVTPGRNVIAVLESFFSWDSCISLVTAERGLLHSRTAKRAIYNCGMGTGGGHFDRYEIFRAPPFNMIMPEEVASVVGIGDLA